MSRLSIQCRRVYEDAARSDGYRVLVDRVWPRGVRKKDAELDEWCRDLAPSKELRQWFGHDPERWQEFQQRYRRELDDQAESLDALLDRARETKSTLTLLYAARDTEHNNAVVLRDYLQSRMQSDNSSG